MHGPTAVAMVDDNERIRMRRKGNERERERVSERETRECVDVIISFYDICFRISEPETVEQQPPSLIGYLLSIYHSSTWLLSFITPGF